MKNIISIFILIALLITACGTGAEIAPKSVLNDASNRNVLPKTYSHRLIKSIQNAPDNFLMTCIVESNNMDDDFPYGSLSFDKNGNFKDIILTTFYPPIKELERLKCNHQNSPFICSFKLGNIIINTASFLHTDRIPLVVDGIKNYYDTYFMSGEFTYKVKTTYTDRPRWISCSGHILAENH